MLKRQSFMILILALMFVAPGLCAYWFYTHPQWLNLSLNNKGVLLNPPKMFTMPSKKPQWHLVLLQAGACDEQCLQQIDKLARIRLALGRRWFDIDEWLVLTNQTPLSKKANDWLAEHSTNPLIIDESAAGNVPVSKDKSGIFLVNPQNYWILRYPLDAASDDIFSDIKQLLNKSG